MKKNCKFVIEYLQGQLLIEDAEKNYKPTGSNDSNITIFSDRLKKAYKVYDELNNDIAHI